MHLSNIFFSVAALAACVTPVLSAPAVEPNTETTSLVMKRSFAAPAEKCYTDVKKKCDDISTSFLPFLSFAWLNAGLDRGY